MHARENFISRDFRFEQTVQTITKTASMKKSTTFRLAALALFTSSLGQISAAPYEPEGRLIRYIQGSTDLGKNKAPMSFRVFGDEYHSRVETLDGYTVVHRFEDDSYYYAQLSADGTRLVRTNEIATFNPSPSVISRGKHIDIPTSQILRNTTLLREQFDNQRKLRWEQRLRELSLSGTPSEERPSVGDVVGLTIIVSFPAGSNAAVNPAFAAAVTAAEVRKFCNFGTDGILSISPEPAANAYYSDFTNQGSVHQYFLDQSGGRFRYVQQVVEVTLDGTDSRDFFNFSDPLDKTVVIPDAREVGRKILAAAIKKLNADRNGVTSITTDSNRRILATNLIVAGLDSGRPMQGIWPHTASINSDLGPYTITPDGLPRTVGEYNLMLVPSSFNNVTSAVIPTDTPTLTATSKQLSIGIFCRENLKMLFGVPDLTAYPNVGVGNQCIMGTGALGSVAVSAVTARDGLPQTTPPSMTPTTAQVTAASTLAAYRATPAILASSSNGGRRPAPLNPHFRNLLGWLTVADGYKELNPRISYTEELPAIVAKASTASNATSSAAIRIRKPLSTTESFIIENRGTTDRWIGSPSPSQLALDTGVAIWHIDDTRNGNVLSPTSLQNGVALEQADGLNNLEADLTKAANLDSVLPVLPLVNHGDAGDLFDLSKPTFTDVTSPAAKWWDGQNSQVQVNVKTFLPASGMIPPKALVEFGTPPNTIVVDSPNGGEVLFVGETIRITWRAGITGNVKIDLMKGGIFNRVIAASVPNNGLFNWPTATDLEFGSDYSVRISSVTNAVPASDFSNGVFTINDGVFPRGDRFPYGWVKPNSANVPWKLTDGQAFEGRYSLVAENVGDGKSAGVSYSSNFKAGVVSFYMKVSTEASSDKVRFFIDGSPQTLAPNSLTPFYLSGEINWRSYSFPLTAGNHTIQWIYEKDDSRKTGSDKVWIDRVILPDTTQEIAIQDPQRNLISSGAATMQLPEANDGGASAAQTFTIFNTGNADLFGLQVSVEGANSGDFTVTAPVNEAVIPGRSTTFGVSFTPKASGLRTATIRVRSNDADESNFLISVEGTGLPYPRIGLSQASKQLVNNDKKRLEYGKTQVRTAGKTKTFTITNNGSSPLTDLSISKDGKFKGVYEVGSLSTTSLVPGESTTVTVKFNPKKIKGNQTAAIRVSSSDDQTGRFDIKLNGEGVAKKKKKSKEALASNVKSSPLSSFVFGSPTDSAAAGYSTAVDVVDGQKYLSLTVTKSAENAGSVIEVSPDLIDWYSGNQYTTTILDNATTLKVRDNAPITLEAKRYIRLK